MFRRPEKFKIGEDFDLFARKIDLYFEAVEVTDEGKKRLAFLFHLNEDAFRLAEGVPFPDEGGRKYEPWLNELKTLFERNETLTEKRYNFHKRTQAVGETVDSFAIGLREYGAKCGFAGNEYTNRLVDQFILGLLDKQTQTRLLQEPPGTLDEALVVARRFEAARSTMQTLRQDTNTGRSTAGAVHADKICFNCNQSGHIAKYCRKGQFNKQAKFAIIVSSQGIFRHFAPSKGVTVTKMILCRPEMLSFVIVVGKKDTARNCGGILQKKCETGETPSTSGIKSNAGAETKIRLSNASPVDNEKTPLVEAKINGQEFICVVDTGASISLLS